MSRVVITIRSDGTSEISVPILGEPQKRKNLVMDHDTMRQLISMFFDHHNRLQDATANNAQLQVVKYI